MRPASYGDLRSTVVVCLDDEREILDGMRALLSGWQCIVLTAADSADALQQLRAAKVTPAMIISDYHLEKQDGIEATQAITAAARAPVPAIIITADRSPLIEARVNDAGLALLRKPVKPAALRALMSQLILKREAAE
jgi:CheY-like chemotaxis protein